MDAPTPTEIEQADGAEDWRVLDGGLQAWFDAPSITTAAALVHRVAELSGADGMPDLDLRPGGVRVRLGAADGEGLTPAHLERARAISTAARDLGLAADPAALQTLRIAISTVDPPALVSFWRTVLAYQSAGTDRLADPSRRDPAAAFLHLDQPRPLRNRIHVDVVRPAEAVQAVKTAVGREAHGPYSLALADDDGNEVDLVPGDALPGGPVTADWRTVFAAMTFYPVTSPGRAGELASAVAGLADAVDVPIAVDVRPDGVTLDSGKDQWEEYEHLLGHRFVELAGRIQSAAHELGHSADPTSLRFVQLGLDAVDVSAVRAFWTSVLGYQHDPRTGLTDIIDPRQLNPVIFFQPMDEADEDRRRQRNRTHLELVVPYDQAQARVDAAVAAGGRVMTSTDDQHTVTDPEGNELVIVARG